LKREVKMSIDRQPVFAIKAADNLSDSIVQEYVNLCYNSGLNAQGEQAQLALDEIRQWRAENPDKCKFPDHMHVPANDDDSFEARLELLEAIHLPLTAGDKIYEGDRVVLGAAGTVLPRTRRPADRSGMTPAPEDL
jgi:hypothetical protein